MNFQDPLFTVLYITEVLACVSFTTSGSIKAFRKKADLLGIILLNLIETFGGGFLRDIIISNGIPHILYDSEYLSLAAISIAITLVWFLLGYFKKTAGFVLKHSHDFWIDALDAVGIAVFAVSGVMVADKSVDTCALLSRDNMLPVYVYIIFLGVTTGVGGGMLRDLFTNEIPMIFRKHFYMTPVIIGSTIFAFMYEILGSGYEILSLSVSCSVIIVLRILAVIFKWNLPKPKAFLELTEHEKNKAGK